MSVAFTDVLIDLANPSRMAEFRRDPDAYLKNRGLSDQEVQALRSAESGPLWRHARSVETTDPSQQFNRFTEPNDLLIEIEPIAEPNFHHEQQNEMVAETKLGLFVVEEDGRLYRVLQDEVA